MPGSAAGTMNSSITILGASAPAAETVHAPRTSITVAAHTAPRFRVRSMSMTRPPEPGDRSLYQWRENGCRGARFAAEWRPRHRELDRVGRVLEILSGRADCDFPRFGRRVTTSPAHENHTPQRRGNYPRDESSWGAAPCDGRRGAGLRARARRLLLSRACAALRTDLATCRAADGLHGPQARAPERPHRGPPARQELLCGDLGSHVHGPRRRGLPSDRARPDRILQVQQAGALSVQFPAARIQHPRAPGQP